MTLTIREVNLPFSEIEIIPGEQHLISIPDKSGDRRVLWDPRNPEDVAWARKQHKDATKKGRGEPNMNAFNIDPNDGSRGEPMDEFDPTAAKMVLVGATAGG